MGAVLFSKVEIKKKVLHDCCFVLLVSYALTEAYNERNDLGMSFPEKLLILFPQIYVFAGDRESLISKILISLLMRGRR